MPSPIDKPFNIQAFEKDRRTGKWNLTRKKSFYQCTALWCKRPRRNAHNSLCFTCASRLWRANNPIAYAFNNLKRHAKQRGIKFTITRAEFWNLIKEQGYIERRGRSPFHLQIDRIDGNKGYEPGNLQVITAFENNSKQHHTDRPARRQMECPF